MKALKTIVLAAALLTSLGAQAQKAFTLTGNFVGLADSMQVELFNREATSEEERVVGTGVINGNTFTIDGKIDDVHFCSLSIGAMHPAFGFMLPLVTLDFIVDGDDMTITSPISINDLHELPSNVKKELVVSIKGGAEQAHYNDYLNAVKAESEESSRLGNEWATESMSHWGDDSFTTPKEDSLRVLYDAALAELDKANKAFIAQHPEYYISGYMIQQEVKDVFAMTADEYRAKAAAVSPSNAAQAEKLQKALERSVKYSLQTPWTDFSGKDPEGAEHSITSLRKPGRFLLMDFWASWCGPCRKAIPRVKKILEDNADRLDLISVDVDQKEADWHKALGEEGMTWPQLRIAGEDAQKAFAAYVIETIPRLVLVSPDGIILAVTHDPNIIKEQLSKNK